METEALKEKMHTALTLAKEYIATYKQMLSLVNHSHRTEWIEHFQALNEIRMAWDYQIKRSMRLHEIFKAGK